MQKKKKQVRSTWLRKLMHVHVLITTLSISVYFVVAFFDPGFLSYDLRQKYHAFALDTIAVSAIVLDVPQKPIVTGVSQCNNSTGVLSIVLDWADDVNTYTYSIARDSLPLVSGLAPSGYSDTNVTLGTTYEYVVTAYGPMGSGFATADTVSVTTLSECEITAAAPAVNLTAFAGRSISSYGGIPRVYDRRPTFSGTTNIPNAIIQVVVGPPSSFVATVTANINGYFEWQPPFNFSYGTQTFTVTAIDPNDSLRQASTSLSFEIKRRSDGSGGSDKKEPSLVETEVPQGTVSAPVDFSLTVENRDKTVFQGQTLNIMLRIKEIATQYQDTNSPVRYSIVDAKGNIITTLMTEELLKKGMTIQKQLEIPLYMAPDKYSVQAEILLEKINVSRIDKFTVAALPLISLGGSAFITYAEVVRSLGWIVLALLVLLLLWLFLFMREYGMYLHALRNITEQHLKKAGFMTKRKGVIR